MFRWIMTFILLWFIFQVRHVFPPIIIGGIIAYLVLPVVQTLSSRAKLPIGIATAIVYFSMLGVIAGSIYFLGPSIAHELKELSNPENQRELVHKAVEQVTGVIKYQGDVDQLTEQVLTSIMHSMSNPQELQKGVGEISHLALSLLVTVVSSIYFTLDSVSVGRFFLRYVPESRKAGIIDLFAQMNKMLSKYVQGQILLIVIMATVAWLFLHFFLHMRYALPVAVFSGFLEIIPVLGPILATSTATLVGIAQFGPHAALVIIVFYTLARWIEDYVVVPKIIGHAVELHPLAVIFAVLCGETLAGGLGMLIAIPVAACIKLVLDYYYTGQLPNERRPEKNKKHHHVKPGAKPAANGGTNAGPSGANNAQSSENISPGSAGFQPAAEHSPGPSSSDTYIAGSAGNSGSAHVVETQMGALDEGQKIQNADAHKEEID